MLDLETRLNRHASQLEALAPEIELPEVRSVSAAHERSIRVPVRVSHRRAVIALAVLALGLVAAAVGYSLRSENVEEGPRLGKFLEMEVAPDGIPFLVYSDQDTGGTVLAKCADRFCEEEPTLTRIEGMFPTVVMRDDGRPLVWIDGPDGEPAGPWLLDCSNAACSEHERIDVPSTPSQIEDLSRSGRALLRYTDDAGRLVLGVCSDAGCVSGITEITVTDGGYEPSYDLFFAPGERPALVYAGGGNLQLGTCGDAGCTQGLRTATVAAGEFHDGTPVAAAIGPEGDVWVAHGRYGAQIVHCDDETCASPRSAPLATDERLWRIEALVGADGLPVFVYNWSVDTQTDVLKVARCEDAACMRGTVTTVHLGKRIGSFSATLDDTGNPVLGVRTDEGVVATVCADPGCEAGAIDLVRWDHRLATTTTTTTIPEPPPEAGGWTRLTELEDAFGPGAVVTGLTHRSDRLVAIGHLCGDAGCRPTAWTSDNGSSWDHHLIDEAGDAHQVTDGRAGLVATSCLDHEECDVGAWHSPDGVEWEPSTFEGCEGGSAPGSCRIGQGAQLIGGPAGYALYGFGEEGAIIWTSVDGLAWEPADLGFSPTYPLGVWSLDERFAAIVEACDAEGSCPQTLWTSEDGVEWVAREDEAARLLWIEQRPVSWGGSALVLGWHDSDGDEESEPHVWTSADGMTWEMAPLAEAPPGNGIVAYSGGLFEASVEFDVLENRERAFTWTSADGVEWEIREWPMDGFPTARDRLVGAALGDGVLVVGDAIWTWFPG